MKFSTLAFLEAEFSTSSSTRATVLSPNSLVVRTLITPVMLIEPLITLSPTFLSCGRLSPVSAAVLTAVLPSITSPSSDLFAGLYDDRFADGDFFRRNLLLHAVAQYVCRVGTNIHQRGDVSAALADRNALEQFANLIGYS